MIKHLPILIALIIGFLIGHIMIVNNGYCSWTMAYTWPSNDCSDRKGLIGR